MLDLGSYEDNSTKTISLVLCLWRMSNKDNMISNIYLGWILG